MDTTVGVERAGSEKKGLLEIFEIRFIGGLGP